VPTTPRPLKTPAATAADEVDRDRVCRVVDPQPQVERDRGQRDDHAGDAADHDRPHRRHGAPGRDGDRPA
jgi:hypothetical protein